MASLSGVFNNQEFTDTGVTLAGGRIYTYAQGTTTQKDVYTDIAGTIPHTYTSDGAGGLYIGLNARGELPAPMYFGAGPYDICLKRADGSTVWTRRADGIGQIAADLAASSGASIVGHNSETVAGAIDRIDATAADAATLRNRITKTLLDFGAKIDGATDDTAAWAAAATWSNSNLSPVFIPAGQTIYSGGDFTADYISFVGAGMPAPNAGNTALVGGTVVKGKLSFKNKTVILANFGADMGSGYSAVASDALVVSNVAGEWVHVENMIGMGRLPTDSNHGILIEGYARATGGNLVGVNNIYGVAAKLRSANIGNVTGINNGENALIVKHDDVYSGAGKCAFGDVLAIGTGTTTCGVRVLCQNAGAGVLEMRDISIGNVVYSGVATGCSVEGDNQSTGSVTMDGISFGDIIGSHTVNAFATVVQAGGAQIYTVKHGDLIVTPTGNDAGVADYEAGFNIVAGRTIADLPAASTRMNNGIYIATAVYNYISSGISMSVDHTATNAGVSSNGSYASVSGIQNFESYGASPIVRTGLSSAGTPASGRYIVGEFLRYKTPTVDANNMTLTGWTRLTTGSGHVIGTDWAESYVSRVSPAA